MKEIKSWVFDPSTSILRQSKNEQAIGFTIKCNNHENCGAFRDGECNMIHTFGHCPYGEKEEEKGCPRTSKDFSSWISDFKEKHAESIPNAIGPTSKLYYVGDFVYIHNSDIINPNYARENKLYHNKDFINKKDFTAEFIAKQIMEYKRDVSKKISKFDESQKIKLMYRILDVDEKLWNEILEFGYGEYVTSDIGRYAVLNTLTPHKGVFTDSNGDICSYDGKYLYYNRNNNVTMFGSNETEGIRIKPSPNFCVFIGDDEQVNPNTVFVD